MSGDITRDTFDRSKHFARVLWQQGRVALDADPNEQAAILLHYVRTLARDLIGPHGGPDWDPAGGGFKVTVAGGKDFAISSGRYYVDGILCENDVVDDASGTSGCTYFTQPDYPQDPNAGLPTNYLVYLDVWERDISYLQDDSIREVALGGPDTAARTKVVWQVKIDSTIQDCDVTSLQRFRGFLRARVTEQAPSTDPCVVSPESRYRGAENQLYRVEVHSGSEVTSGPTFKWSRDNGSVCFAIRTLAGTAATVESLGRDDRHTLQVGDLVEILDDHTVLLGEPGSMARVEKVDRDSMTVTVKWASSVTAPPGYDNTSATRHPLLKRWDHQTSLDKDGVDGALPISEDPKQWIALEDGIQVSFLAPGAIDNKLTGEKNVYRTGDYWLIPARTATGGIEWPSQTDSAGKSVPKALPPHGVDHHYAPLARVTGGTVQQCRCMFEKKCP